MPGGGQIVRHAVLALLASTILLPSVLLSQDIDEPLYRSLNSQIWAHTWGHLSPDGPFLSRPRHFVNKRAFVVSTGPGADVTTIDDDCLAIGPNMILGIKYAQDMSSSGNLKTVHAQDHEFAYGHTTDPASFQVFQARDGASDVVELRWELDERDYELCAYVYYQSRGDWVDPDTFTPAYEYIIKRGVDGGDLQTVAEVELDELVDDFGRWTDYGVEDDTIYEYQLFTKVDATELEYSYPKSVFFQEGISPPPAVWIGRIWGAHPDPNNASSLLQDHLLYVTLWAYRPEPGFSPNCEIRHPGGKRGGEANDTIALTEVFSAGDYHEYRLQIDADDFYTYDEYDLDDEGQLVPNPNELGAFTCWFYDDEAPLFAGETFTSAPSNRVRSNQWLNYLANITYADYQTTHDFRNAWLERTNQLLNDDFDGIFGDGADIALHSYWDAMPDYYDDQAQFENSVTVFLDEITDAMNAELIVNGAYQYPPTTYAEVGGVMYENFVATQGTMDGYHGSINSGTPWAKDIDTFRGIIETTGPYTEHALVMSWADPEHIRARLFAYASFLLLSHESPLARFTYRDNEWLGARGADIVPIVMPEQMLSLGNYDVVIDPDGVNFPDPDDYAGFYSCEGDATLQGHDLVVGYFREGRVVLNIGHPACAPQYSSPKDHDFAGTMYLLRTDDRSLFDGGRLWTVPVSGSITVEPLTAAILLYEPIASPDVGTAAAPLYAGVPSQQIRILTASWNGGPLWFELDTSAVSASSSVFMTDNGDGNYVSPGIDISQPPGIYELRAYVCGEDGLAVYQTVEVAIIEEPEMTATYVDKSSEVPISYEGKPYSSIPLDYNDDGWIDLFVTSQDGYPTIHKNLASEGNPEFLEDTINVLSGGISYLATRGAAAGDFDWDGVIDLFVAHDSEPLLFRGEEGQPGQFTLTNVAAEYGITQEMTEHSWAGSWADFNDDGYLDLYISRAYMDPLGGDPELPSQEATPVRDSVLYNHLFELGQFSDLSGNVFLGPAQPSAAAAWADYDRDGQPDCFVPATATSGFGQGAHFWESTGSFPLLVDRFAEKFRGVTISHASSAEWVDLNNDDYPDLVLSQQEPPAGEGFSAPYVFLNVEGATGREFAEADYLQFLNFGTRDVRAVDYNLDGWQDLLMIPFSGAETPRLYHNHGASGSLAFSDVTGATALAGIITEIGGATIADFNADRDLDLFLGCDHDESEYLKTCQWSGSGENPSEPQIGVRLMWTGAHDATAIGARVGVRHINGGQLLAGVQTVNGGLGRGGQGAPVLWFGLGGYSESTVIVEADWPNGAFSSGTYPVEELNEIVDPTDPYIIEDSLTVSEALGLSYRYWDVAWDTAYRGDPHRDHVVIETPSGDLYAFYAIDRQHDIDIFEDGGVIHHRYTDLKTSCEVGLYTITVYTMVNGHENSESIDVLGRYCTVGIKK